MGYTKDLKNKDWKIIESFFPREKRGRPREHSYRVILNAIFYVLTNGVKWRDLPENFPPWKTVYHYFVKWSNNGLLEKIQEYLNAKVRKKSRKKKEASLLAMDSCSIKSTKEAQEKGFDGHKKIKGVKIHILVDTLGLIHKMKVTKANENDKTVALELFEEMSYLGDSIKKIVADQGYKGRDLIEKLKNKFGVELLITEKLGEGFKPAPFRWIVERTFAWLSFCRRLSKNYERKLSSFVSWIRLSMIRLCLSRLYCL